MPRGVSVEITYVGSVIATLLPARTLGNEPSPIRPTADFPSATASDALETLAHKSRNPMPTARSKCAQEPGPSSGGRGSDRNRHSERTVIDPAALLLLPGLDRPALPAVTPRRSPWAPGSPFESPARAACRAFQTCRHHPSLQLVPFRPRLSRLLPPFPVSNP